MLNRYAPSIIEAAVLAFFTAGFGGELFGSTAAGGSGATTATTGLSADEISQINAAVNAETTGMTTAQAIDISSEQAAFDAAMNSIPTLVTLTDIGTMAGTGASLLTGGGGSSIGSDLLQLGEKVGLTAATTAAGIETQKLLAPSNDAMLPPMSQPANTPNPNAAKTVLLLAAAGLGLFALVHT